ncbi:hypothetical protein CYJ66_04315 [Gardnerella vaginalis]|nr:hypothetical protein CYJ68_06220 [Gardnerella vaginalis]PKZ54420.1 hypothetical protein CYJ66_04315 [Gardnerella vaginalis]PKZ56531.1 hypothetical protein CYJ64_04315 [Gardnerella vaginalis]
MFRTKYITKCGRDSRFFAADEANLSIFDGDSLKQQEKSRISGDQAIRNCSDS